jgi:hypothetical protein
MFIKNENERCIARCGQGLRNTNGNPNGNRNGNSMISWINRAINRPNLARR